MHSHAHLANEGLKPAMMKTSVLVKITEKVAQIQD